MIALSGAAASCDALGPTLSTEPGMHGDQRLVLRTWDPCGDLGLSLPRTVFPVGILEKVGRGHSHSSGRNYWAMFIPNVILLKPVVLY